MKLLHDFPEIVQEAGEKYSPAIIANYAFELAKEYNQFYQEIPILKAETDELIHFRIGLSEFVGKVVKTAMGLLGVGVPGRM